jgi:hypothetical protein
MKTLMKMSTMYSWKKIASIIILILMPVVSVFLTGCASTQDGAGFASSGMARLQIVNKTGSGKGSTVSTVYSVDGETESVDVNKTYVLVNPGSHSIAFNHCQIVNPGSSMGISVNFFGVQNDVVTPRPEELIKNLQQIKVDGRFEAGKTYWIDSSSLVFKAYEPYPNSISISGLGGDMYTLTGNAHIREKINKYER